MIQRFDLRIRGDAGGFTIENFEEGRVLASVSGSHVEAHAKASMICWIVFRLFGLNFFEHYDNRTPAAPIIIHNHEGM